ICVLETGFLKRELGRGGGGACPADATALLELAPTALVFGAWHSQGEGGGLGAKFARVLVSEIMGINVPVDESPNPRTGEIVAQTAGRRTGSRIDPLGVLRKVEVYKSPTDWATDKDAAGRGARQVRPSEINHGNIAPTVTPLGVTCAHAEHRAVISLAGLRRLRFGSDDRNSVARELLLLIGLIALSEQDTQGYALRSRCDLVCDDVAPVELVHPDGSTTTMELVPDDLRQRYGSAFDRAVDAGFEFDWLRLAPQPKLIEIVQRSRKLALEGAGGDDE
ncbi:MAG: type I-U CRISPR-associated protein Cas7, partial [Gammaproteobacteria bacterium]|nr:type I-U CRISPR-associated protein Cas7 [Gammaproteobacteria bacterium]